MALFIMDVLKEALVELQAAASGKTEQFYHSSIADERNDYSNIVDSALPESLQSTLNGMFYHESIPDVNKLIFLKQQSFCHTPLLPSEIRYSGILTESDKASFFLYEKGYSDALLRAFEMQNRTKSRQRRRTMRLSYDQYSRSRNSCPGRHLTMDYRDFFYISSYNQDWTYMTIPNEAEMKHYGLDSIQLEGLIMVCPSLSSCEQGACNSEDFQGQSTIDKDLIDWKVNDLPVTGLSKIDACYMLKHDGGHFWTPNEDRQFVIAARLEVPDYKYLKLSSFILF